MTKPQDMGKATAETGVEARYKGIRKRKWGKWVSEVRLPNCRERIWLGSYDTPEKAARAFDAAVFCLRGRKARFNFPHDLPDIAGGPSLSPPEIQAAAARFANEAQPPSEAEDRSRGSVKPDSPAASTTTGTLSDGGFTAESSGADLDWSLVDLLASTDSGARRPEFTGAFPMIDDFPWEFFPVTAAPAPPAPPSVDFGDENVGGVFATQQSFLWNF